MTISAVVAGLVGLIAREIIQYVGGLIGAWWTKFQTNRAADQKADDHAAAVTKEMNDAHTPEAMDRADSDILSGD